MSLASKKETMNSRILTAMTVLILALIAAAGSACWLVMHPPAGRANPLPTDALRAVVEPSPDQLYAVCIFDVGAGPLRVAIIPPQSHRPLSLNATSSENVFTLSAADATSGGVELILGPGKDAAKARTDFPEASLTPRLVARCGGGARARTRSIALNSPRK
jgi:uncharacterized membrane protein